MVAGGRMRKGIIRELGMDMYTLLYLKRITKDLLHKHREFCSMLCASLNGRGVSDGPKGKDGLAAPLSPGDMGWRVLHP